MYRYVQFRPRGWIVTATILAGVAAGPAGAEEFRLLTGVNAGLYPAPTRTVAAIPGSASSAPGSFNDGQRLGGLPVAGPAVTWQGSGTPLFPPNHVGAMSFFFRRGSVPLFANHVLPFMGIDFLGGPLLDLDGNLGNGTRSLTPVIGQTPIAIPGTSSHVDLSFDIVGGTVTLSAIDFTGTNEGGPGVNPGAATTISVLADNALNGGPAGPVNSAFDTRVGTLTAFTGTGGTLSGVYRIQGLQAELWYDSVDPNSSSANLLGTFQQFERIRGWLIRRGGNGQFPTLAGQGFGSTLWPRAETSITCPPLDPCVAFNRAFDIGFGLTADITDGNPTDRFSQPAPNSNLGLPLTDFGGDLGAYLDAVVVPQLAANVTGFVYLESSGFGINNTGDPVFGNSNGYDMVIVAASTQSTVLLGDVNGDGVVNPADAAALAAAIRNPAGLTPAQFTRADVNGDLVLNGLDIQVFINILL